MKTPNPVDANVGAVVRARRRSLGMSQGKLGQALGINLQQVQKNESGTNRLGASRLQQLSNILGVPVAYFFKALPPERRPATLPAVTKTEQIH
jgi:transcriptional regulator with XRE-family HTH domain